MYIMKSVIAFMVFAAVCLIAQITAIVFMVILPGGGVASAIAVVAGMGTLFFAVQMIKCHARNKGHKDWPDLFIK